MLKPAIKTAYLVIFLSTAVHGAPWDLLGSWPTPGGPPRDTTDPYAQYLVAGGSEPYIYRVWWLSGGGTEILSSFPAPGGAGAWGLAYDPGPYCFWLSNNQTSWIYKITTLGSLVSSFPSPLAGPAGMELAGDYNPYGDWLFVAFPSLNVIGEINQTTGSLIETFPAPGAHATACGGLVYSYGYSFYVTDDYTHAVYKNGAPVITSLPAPVGFSYIANTNDQVINIYVVDDATDYIYAYVTDEPYSAASPASLGRIKALYR